jgi:hypothetical protein
MKVEMKKVVMNIGDDIKIPVIPLILLYLAYALLGWYLASHHIIWLVGAFVVAVVLTVVIKSISWLEQLIEFGSQTLIVVLSLSASLALIAAWSILLTLFLLPLTTTILADLEMRLVGLSNRDRFLIITVLAGLGLAAGEIIDIGFLPSKRY